MITKIVLGTNVEIQNVSDIQESIQNTGEYIKKALTINLVKNLSGNLQNLTDLESILRVEGALNNIKIFKKDVIESNYEGDVEILVYSEEYLESEHTQYTNIQSIIKHSDNSMVSITLTVDPTSISDEKATRLSLENVQIRQQSAELLQAIAELTEILSMMF